MLEISNIKVYDLEESVIASGNAMRTVPPSYTQEEFEAGLIRAERLAKLGGGTGHSNFRTGIRVSFDLKYPNYISPELQRYHFIDIVTSSSKMHMISKMNFKNCCNKYVSKSAIAKMEELKGFYNFFTANEDFGSKMMRNFARTYEEYIQDNYFEQITFENPQDMKYDCFMRMVSECPQGIELFMRISTNYEQLATIYKQRKEHKLKEDWGAFCKFIEELPYANILITNKK